MDICCSREIVTSHVRTKTFGVVPTKFHVRVVVFMYCWDDFRDGNNPASWNLCCREFVGMVRTIRGCTSGHRDYPHNIERMRSAPQYVNEDIGWWCVRKSWCWALDDVDGERLNPDM